jgi:hypothetical protein
VTAPFLITGCGRSGTGWAAALFTALGYPCGHEKAFNPARSGPLTAPESSWLAVPHLDALPPHTPVLRIMRDPYAVVQSIVVRGFLRDGRDAFDVYVETHRPDITQGTRDHLGRAIRYAALWDEPMDDRTPLLRAGHFDESARIGSVVGAVWEVTREVEVLDGVRDALVLVGSQTNTTPYESRPVPAPTIEQIMAHPDGALIAARADKYGY